MERPASRASRYCVIPLSSRAVTRIFPNGHGEDFLLIFFQAHQPIHFVQQVTGRNAKPPSKTNDHPGFGLSLGVFKLIQVFLSDTCSYGYSLLCAFETLLSVIDSTAATPHNRKPHEVRECGKTCPPLELRKGTGLFAQKMCTASFLQLISKKKSLNLHHMRQQAVPPHGRVALDGLLQFG